MKRQEVTSFGKGNSSWRKGKKNNKKITVSVAGEGSRSRYLERLWDLPSLEIFET